MSAESPVTAPSAAEAKVIADEIVKQSTVCLGDDDRPTAGKGILLTRARWAAIVSLLRERERMS